MHDGLMITFTSTHTKQKLMDQQYFPPQLFSVTKDDKRCQRFVKTSSYQYVMVRVRLLESHTQFPEVAVNCTFMVIYF